jgi:chemotaxis signal transduction protein
MIPNAAIAEVITLGELAEPAEGQPEWVEGMLTWRFLQVPVVRLEKLVTPGSVDVPSSVQAGRRERILVCHSFVDGAEVPFMGILIADLPDMVLLDETDVEDREVQGDAAPILGSLAYQDQQYMVPDLQQIGALLPAA